ncbi:MAG: hypothetical protein ACLFP8_06900 [Alphaproteobacteria bacterium]
MKPLPPVKIGKIGQIGIHQQRFSLSAMRPVLWLDAADSITITENSGTISQWRDKSGNNRHFTQDTASAQPLTGANTINGRNVITFDGVGEKLLGDHIIGLYDGLSAFLVTNSRCSEKADGFGFVIAINGYGWLTAEENAPAFNFSSNGLNQANWQIANKAHSTPQTEEPKIYSCTSTGTDVQYYTNGTLTSGNTTGSATEGGSPSYIGGTTGMNHYKGDLAEVIIFERVLSTMQKNQVGSYLSKKWAINWADL